MNRGKIQVLKATSRTDTSPGRICFAKKLFKDAELIIEFIYSRIDSSSLTMKCKGLGMTCSRKEFEYKPGI
jgi:hypothetical protein